MKRIVAIMPIKLKNERLPNKNTMVLGDRPLLQYELKTLQSVKKIQEIYVFCSDEMVKEFLPQGIIFLKRSEQLDSQRTNFNQIFDSFKKNVDADIYVYAHATAPFIKRDTVCECIDAVLSGQYDSAFCAQKIQDYLWENGEPLNFQADNLPRSQDLGVIYRETSGVYVFTKETYEKLHRRVGKKPYIKQVDYREAVDINTREDFELAKKLL